MIYFCDNDSKGNEMPAKKKQVECPHIATHASCPAGVCTKGTKELPQLPFSEIKGVWFCTDCDSVVLETPSGHLCLCDEEGDVVFHEDKSDFPESWIQVDIKVFDRD